MPAKVSVEQIADAVLYEGYLLYPYRASALKNRQRWNFGVIYPRQHSEMGGGAEPWYMQTQCLLICEPSAQFEIKLRFLRLMERVTQSEPHPLTFSWQEAAECNEVLQCSLGELLAGHLRRQLTLPACSDTQDGVTRSTERIDGFLDASVQKAEAGALRLTVRIENRTQLDGCNLSNRQDVLRQCLISAHLILRTRGGEFISLLDPPEQFRDAAANCINIGTWPVLAGEEGGKDVLLSSPIILYDYPQIAAESPGELFDGTEIDEILSLRILTMTDEEKEEVRRTDEKARMILERTEMLTAEHFLKLHGVLRESGEREGPHR